MVEAEPKKKHKIALSTASRLPFSLFGSTRNSEKFANEIGADGGLEILPTYAVIWEIKQNKKLSISKPEVVTSIHTGWANDRARDKSLQFNPGIFAKAITLFLPSEWESNAIVKELELQYPKATVVFHWPEDSNRYTNKKALENHHLVGRKDKDDKPMSIEDILNWVNEDPEKRKLALDISIRKLHAYCKTQGIEKTADIIKVMEKLLPHAGIIHFQAADKIELDAIWKGDMNSELAELTRKAKEKAPEDAQFVIELNWMQVFKKYGFKWKEFYKRAVQFIKKA